MPYRYTITSKGQDRYDDLQTEIRSGESVPYNVRLEQILLGTLSQDDLTFTQLRQASGLRRDELGDTLPVLLDKGYVSTLS